MFKGSGGSSGNGGTLTGIRAGLTAAVAMGLAAVAVVGVLATETSAQAGEAEEAAPTESESESIYWETEYPDQYASFATPRWKVGLLGEVCDIGHYHARSSEADFVAAQYGTSFCMSCKSTPDYDALYEKYGEDLWAISYEDIQKEVEGYWGCANCHDSETLELTADKSWLTGVASESLANVDIEELVCGQCHNGECHYIEEPYYSGVTYDDLNDPYRYGFDADALYQAYVEDGFLESNSPFANVDEATGAPIYDIYNNVFEMYQNSVHQSMGLSCVDCHMVETTNQDGEAYTSHNASGNPLENEEALQKCLTCHKSQGVETTAQMVEFVEKAQAELDDAVAEAQAKVGFLTEALTEATSAGVEGDAIDQARENYSKARFYLEYCVCGSAFDENMVLHNPVQANDLAVKAGALAEEGLELLG